MLEGRKILLGITGSIAAFKTPALVRLLIKAGAEVKVIMTPAAHDFVSPLTLSTLSRNPVLASLANGENWSNHVMLGRWADLMLIAPLSCNTLSKMASGQCDNLLLAVYLSATCPVVVAPAMDEDMWKHPSTKANLHTLTGFGNTIIPVDTGDLASGLVGEGRMAEPENILRFIDQRFFLTGPLQGKKAVVTAGPTYEPIDPVRFIGNHSTGKMGIAIAEELASRGAEVTLVLGPSAEAPHVSGLKTIRVNTAAEMHKEVTGLFPETDLAVMAAAVADYSPASTAKEKIKKGAENLNLNLVKTPDILKTIGEQKKNGQVVVGFALETTQEEDHAREKLIRKNADLIILNSLNDQGAGFGHDTNKITIFGKDGQAFRYDTKSKKEVARDITDTIIRLYYA